MPFDTFGHLSIPFDTFRSPGVIGGAPPLRIQSLERFSGVFADLWPGRIQRPAECSILDIFRHLSTPFDTFRSPSGTGGAPPLRIKRVFRSICGSLARSHSLRGLTSDFQQHLSPALALPSIRVKLLEPLPGANTDDSRPHYDPVPTETVVLLSVLGCP